MNTTSLSPKALIKHSLQRSLPSTLTPILVASMGRSGSTLVHNAICEAVTIARFPKPFRELGVRIVRDQAWDLDKKTFAKGCVYKTHGLANELPQKCTVKVIFLFGSATDAALSVLACRDNYGSQWIDEHFKHLRANGPFEDIGKRDVLRFGEQLDGWIGKSGTERLILHYDALWDHEDTLANFVGAPVRLPQRRQRRGASAATPETYRQFSKTYAVLDARISALPACQLLK